MRKLLSVIVSCCLAATAFGDLVWDNGDIDEANGLCCQRVGAVPVADEADDFHTDQTWTITGAYWETVDDATYAWDGTDDMIIYEYTANGPGAPVVELWNVPNTREQLGTLFSRPWYGYTIDLTAEDMEFDLSAGDYFLLLRPFSPGNVGQSFWLTSPGNANSQSQGYFRSEYFGYPNWVPNTTVFGNAHDVNFKLYGVPEPASLLLLGLGGLALLRRR